MNADSLSQLLTAAEESQRCVWLKHRFDRNPQLGRFTLKDDGTLNVPLYLSFLDDYEGLMNIKPESVEWAHISARLYPSTMRERLTHAEATGTLVRLAFSDFLDRQLFHCVSHAKQSGNWHADGHFVQNSTLASDPQCSRVPQKVLLDIENTDIPSASIKPQLNFMEVCCDPNLKFFAKEETAE